jgi:polysaccharide chain length determinant protein (PEP-CTERM system associated)
MQEILNQLLAHLRGMWHRRWIGLAAAWVVAIVGVAIVYRVPEKYEASARVYVDTESVLRPLLQGVAIQPNVDQQVSLISRTLISRPNVDKLVRLADLDLQVKTPADREDVIDRVIKSIRLEGTAPNSGASNLYVLSYRDPEPARAQKVVQSLLGIFVESSLGDKRQDTQSAVKFLDEQIKRYEATLQAAENRIKEFRLKYIGVSARDGQDYFARMQRIGSEIESAKLELESAQQARDAYKLQIAGEPPMLIPNDLSAAHVADSSPEISSRIAALRRDLDGLLRKYTDQHPDVVATKRLIAELEEQRKEELDARRKAAMAAPPGQSGPVDNNPVTQQIKISLADAEANVAAARAKLTGLQSQYHQLQSQAQLVPQVEAEFAALSRDYDVQKKTYETLISRREAATMGKDVQDTGGTQFRVIDPPRVSPQPVAPNRVVLLGVVFGLTIASGVFAAFLASQMMPTFNDSRTLREVSKRPLLGMVSMLPSEALMRMRRRNAWLFAGGSSGLIASFSLVIVIALVYGRFA